MRCFPAVRYTDRQGQKGTRRPRLTRPGDREFTIAFTFSGPQDRESRPMPEITTGAIFSVNADGTLFGQQVLLTTHWKVQVVSPTIVFQDDDLFTQLNTEFQAFDGWLKQYTGVTSQSLISIKQVSQVLYPGRFIRRENTLLVDTGEVAEDSLPPNVSHAITLRTDVAGRDQMGTKHVGAVPPSFTEGGYLTEEGLSALQGLATALVKNYTVTVDGSTVTVAPIIYRRSDVVNSPFITNFIIGDTTRVERRRTVRLGS